MADQPRPIDTLPQTSNLRQIVQHSETTAVSELGDQAQNRIGTDIDESTYAERSCVCAAASSGENEFSDSVRIAVELLHPSRHIGQRSLRHRFLFGLAPEIVRISGGSRPKLTFIG